MHSLLLSDVAGDFLASSPRLPRAANELDDVIVAVEGLGMVVLRSRNCLGTITFTKFMP